MNFYHSTDTCLMVDKDELCGGTLSEQRTWIVRMKAAKKAMARHADDKLRGDVEN